MIRVTLDNAYAAFWESLDRQTWMQEGLCAQCDPELWHPDKGGRVDPAKRICARCPVVAQCLQYALERPELSGVWGGTSDTQRERMRGRREEAVACQKGHPRTEFGVKWGNKTTWDCRACKNERRRKLRADGRAA